MWVVWKCDGPSATVPQGAEEGNWVFDAAWSHHRAIPGISSTGLLSVSEIRKESSVKPLREKEWTKERGRGTAKAWHCCERSGGRFGAVCAVKIIGEHGDSIKETSWSTGGISLRKAAVSETSFSS
jgi:hypothetical protein